MSDDLERDPLDWAVERLTWDHKYPDDFEYDWHGGRDEPVLEISERVLKRLLGHLIRNADYDGLVVAMQETEAVLAEQRDYDLRARQENALYAHLQTVALTKTCPTCTAVPGDPCRGPRGALPRPHARR